MLFTIREDSIHAIWAFAVSIKCSPASSGAFATYRLINLTIRREFVNPSIIQSDYRYAIVVTEELL